MKYILDFDSTLFHSRKCYEHITELKGNFEFKPIILEDINVCEFLYDDVLDWLETKKKEDLFILTAISPKYGEQAGAFQKEKLGCSTLSDKVKEVVFMEGLKGGPAVEIASQFPPDETIIFVDDKIEQCLSVKACLPNALCCLMVRDKDVIGEVDSIQDIKVVHSLSEVDAIIEEI